MSRHYEVESNAPAAGSFAVVRTGHGARDYVADCQTHAEAANVCSALNAMEHNVQAAEAFEAMREALRDVAEAINIDGEPAFDINLARDFKDEIQKAIAALALADKVSR